MCNHACTHAWICTQVDHRNLGLQMNSLVIIPPCSRIITSSSRSEASVIETYDSTNRCPNAWHPEFFSVMAQVSCASCLWSPYPIFTTCGLSPNASFIMIFSNLHMPSRAQCVKTTLVVQCCWIIFASSSKNKLAIAEEALTLEMICDSTCVWISLPLPSLSLVECASSFRATRTQGARPRSPWCVHRHRLTWALVTP